MHRGKSKLPRLERPTAYTQLDHKTVSIGGIAQIQHKAIANIDRRRRQNIDPKSPDAIYGVTRSKGRIWRARSSKYQAIVFAHELQPLCGKENKPGTRADLVGLPQIPRSARARIARDLITKIAHQRDEIKKIVACSHHDQIIERACLRAIPEQAAQRVARWNDRVIADR